jgi:type II secretory pathway component PulC
MLNVLFLTVGMVFVAIGINYIIVANLAGLLVTQPPLPEARPAAPEVAEVDESAISDLFTVEAVEDEGDIEPSDGDDVVEDDEGPQGDERPMVNGCIAAELPVVLVGTMSEEDPAWSFAVVQNPEEGRTVVVRAGDPLAGAWVVSVGRNLVVLDVGGEEQCLVPNMEAVARQTPTPSQSSRNDEQPRTHQVVQRTTPPARVDLASHVRHIEATHYEIDGAALREILENPDQLQDDMPELGTHTGDDGQPIGVRLEEVADGTALTHIGLRTGDVISHVNGRRVNTPQRAMELIEALGSETHVEVSILRGRSERTRTMVYDIQ